MEPKIIINGQKLNEGQVMTLRAALGSFLMDIKSNGLGEDEHGKKMAEGYLARGREVELLMVR